MTRIYCLKFPKIKVYFQVRLICEHHDLLQLTLLIPIIKWVCISNSILFVYILNFNLTNAESCIHHYGVTLNSFIATDNFCPSCASLSSLLPLLEVLKSLSFHSICRFALLSMSYDWNHILYILFRLTSFTLQ